MATQYDLTVGEDVYWVRKHQYPDCIVETIMCDMADNPNRIQKSFMKLNAFTTYFRLNETGKWITIDNMEFTNWWYSVKEDEYIYDRIKQYFK